MSKIGFCCKWKSPTGCESTESLLNQKTTTITALSKKSPTEQEKTLLGLVNHNLDTANRLIKWVGDLPEAQRLLRLTSDMLPGYSHELTHHVYSNTAMRAVMETGFAKMGQSAREAGVRLSFHPGQFCLLNNGNPGIYEKSVEELEYHTQMFLMMGYRGWHDRGATINIHTGSRAGGVDGFIKGLDGLSVDARNFLTVENDEFSFGLSSLEPLAEHVAIVLDIHHEWIFSQGEFIQPDDERIDYVKASWRGVRPLGHYSISPEMHLPKHPIDVLPDFTALLTSGINRKMLRAHSDMCWNTACNDWALSHLSWMDIEVEAKDKNLASAQLYTQSLNHPSLNLAALA